MISVLQAQNDPGLLAVRMNTANMLGLHIMESAMQAAKNAHRV